MEQLVIYLKNQLGLGLGRVEKRKRCKHTHSQFHGSGGGAGVGKCINRKPPPLLLREKE